MAITQNHVINIQPGVSAPLVIHCSQGDTGTQINLTVVNGDEEFDCSSYACSVHGVRSDGGNWGPITCTVSGSTVCFSLTSAMTAVAGACLAEISVGTVGTANFAILVENAIFENGVTYSNDVSVYQSILNAVQAGLSLAEAAVTNEKNERIAAVTNEKSERIAAITNEKSERVNADNSLSSRISQNDARINNLVGNTGNSNSEIVDARVGVDGSVYSNLGTAIRTQVSELKYDLDSILDFKNLFDKNNVKIGYRIKTDGWLLEEADSFTSGFIRVECGKTYKKNSPSEDGYHRMCIYDENYEILHDTIDIKNEFKVTNPDACFVRFSGKLEELDSTTLICIDSIGAKDTSLRNIILNKIKLISPRFENGTFEDAGNEVSSTTNVRTRWIDSDGYDRIIVTFPTGLKFFMNSIDLYGVRRNTAYITSFTNITGLDKFRLGFRYANDTSIQGDVSKYLDDIKIYLVKTRGNDFDITIAPSDATTYDKEQADFVLDGSNDTDIIQAIMASRESIRCLLYCGTYNVTSKHGTLYDKECVFSTSQDDIGRARKVELIGKQGGYISNKKKAVNFVISKELHESIDSETAIFLIPRAGGNEDTTYSYNTLIRMENINIIGYGYDKPIVYMDFLQGRCCEIEKCYIRSDGLIDGLPQFEYIPNSELTGIRVGHGSNNGVHNYVKHCYVMYCYTGVSCCGEHYIFEDVLTHHCYIGFVFGDKITRVRFEHPNIMIGCSIEGCYRFMLLTKNGIMEEQEFVPDSSNNLFYSTLIVIGLSTESWWGGTSDGLSVAKATKSILEILKGAYNGRIEVSTTNDEIFENGSGKHMDYTIYKDNVTYKKYAENVTIRE